MLRELAAVTETGTDLDRARAQQAMRTTTCGTPVTLRVPFTNEAEGTIRPVKVQQRASGGCWRTLDGLADFADVQSYLSTAAKWGIPKIDALRGLFSGNAWMPPGIEPELSG